METYHSNMARRWVLSLLYMGFANAKVQLDYGQLLDNIHRIQARNNIKLSDSLKSGGLGVCSHGNIKFEAY